jgi:hypothetical protein
MDAGVGGNPLGNQFGLRIDVDVPFVAVVVLTVLFCPAGITSVRLNIE